MTASRLLPALALAAAAGTFADSADSQRILFNRDIRPIFSNTCFHCHGPDPKTREAKLRMDDPEDATRARKDFTPIVPGKPLDSEAYRRMITDDPDLQMPPPDSKLRVSPEQIATVKRWIEQGAEYQKHWAFVPPTKANPPVTADNPIDGFVRARLAKENLRPATPADKATLIRRATLDLLGLPPTPEEVEAFVADSAPDAYEKVVDRLLASPHYGERMAQDWLDAARFGDTHGYQIDFGRDMSLWREWVIDAYNQNMPFDQFTIEQLAGDLLPNATLEQKIASGFSRNAMSNSEGGIIAEEYRYAYAVDRSSTVGTVWLGLTFSCAQCHDHKYDPISTREFHQLTAFFENVNETLGGRGNLSPTIKAPPLAMRRELTKIQAELAELEAKLANPGPAAIAAQAAWEEQMIADGNGVRWETRKPTQVKSEGGATLTVQDDLTILASGKNPGQETYVVTTTTQLSRVTGLRLEMLADDSLPAKGPGRASNGNMVTTNVTVRVALPDGSTLTPTISATSADYSQDGYDVSYLVDADPQSGWAIHPQVGKSHEAVLVFAEPLVLPADAAITVVIENKTKYNHHQPGRFRIAFTDADKPNAETNAIRNLLMVSGRQLTEGERNQIRRHFLEEVYDATASISSRMKTLRAAVKRIDDAAIDTMVMADNDPNRKSYVRIRGQYDSKGEEVQPDVPQILGQMPADAPKNRLGLAQWLVSGRNPITARVVVNRYWQRYFGAGLVTTPEDFGSQGAWPTHPDLLDFLAVEFVDGGWDVKHLQKLIVTSQTYRQRSHTNQRLQHVDPKNALLARGPRIRLPAETIRDQALAVSGLLNDEIGGKSVKVYQPAGLWEELGYRDDGAYQKFSQDHGGDLYRRSIYVYAKRTSPLPFLATFDAPDRQTCSVSRSRTNTPLQALNLMNDVAFVEAARKLAERVLLHGGSSIDDRISYAFRVLLARPPSAAESRLLRSQIQAEFSAFQGAPERAAELLKVGESPVDQSLAPAELAAWTLAANTLLNLDETVTKQ